MNLENLASIFIAPSGREQINPELSQKLRIDLKNFKSQRKLVSLEGIITIDDVSNLISPIEITSLSRAFDDQKLKVWGAKPNRSTLIAILRNTIPNCLVLFYQMGYLTYIARCTNLIESTNLGNGIWGADSSGESWSEILILKNVRYVNIPWKEFCDRIGYGSHAPMSFQPIGNRSFSKALEFLKSIS